MKLYVRMDRAWPPTFVLAANASQAIDVILRAGLGPETDWRLLEAPTVQVGSGPDAEVWATADWIAAAVARGVEPGRVTEPLTVADVWRRDPFRGFWIEGLDHAPAARFRSFGAPVDTIQDLEAFALAVGRGWGKLPPWLERTCVERARFYVRAYALGRRERASRVPLYPHDILDRLAQVWPGVWTAWHAMRSVMVLGYRMGRQGAPLDPAQLHDDDRPNLAALQARLDADPDLRTL